VCRHDAKVTITAVHRGTVVVPRVTIKTAGTSVDTGDKGGAEGTTKTAVHRVTVAGSTVTPSGTGVSVLEGTHG
jgi:hypothetical protein